jgi:hypothetical protein
MEQLILGYAALLSCNRYCFINFYFIENIIILQNSKLYIVINLITIKNGKFKAFENNSQGNTE